MPVVSVFAAIFDEYRRILCVQQNYGVRDWTPPGGIVEIGESPSVALEREVREESGYLVQTEHLIGVYAKPFRDDLVLFFAAHILDQEAWQPDNEIAGFDFFAQDQLPTPMYPIVHTAILDAFDGQIGVFRECWEAQPLLR